MPKSNLILEHLSDYYYLLWSKKSCGLERNICLIFTTGPPKGAILTHANLVADISAYRMNMRQVRISGAPITFQGK